MNLIDIYRAVGTSKTLEKLAVDARGVVRDTVLQTKEAVDAEIFAHIKTAMGPLATKLMKGALVATAAAAPLGLAGYHIMNKADETSSLLQNRLLQTALALAGVGAGLYGLNKLTTDTPKMASADEDLLNEASEKLAAVGMLDELLNDLPKSLSEDTLKLAQEIRASNRGYGIHLLSELAD